MKLPLSGIEDASSSNVNSPALFCAGNFLVNATHFLAIYGLHLCIYLSLSYKNNAPLHMSLSFLIPFLSCWQMHFSIAVLQWERTHARTHARLHPLMTAAFFSKPSGSFAPGQLYVLAACFTPSLVL